MEKKNCYDSFYLSFDKDHTGFLLEYSNSLAHKLYGVDKDKFSRLEFAKFYLQSEMREWQDAGHAKYIGCASRDLMTDLIARDLDNNISCFLTNVEDMAYPNQYYWVGRMYVYLHWQVDTTTKAIFNKISVEEMLSYYDTGHQLGDLAFWEKIKWKFE